MNRLMALCLFAVAAATLANEQQRFTENANWAKRTAQSLQTTQRLPLDINEYCVSDDRALAECQREIANPSQAQLNDANMDSEKTRAMANNELAQRIKANGDKPRPDFRQDTKFRFALLSQENAYEITHGISNQYVNCDTNQQCLFDDQINHCFAPTVIPATYYCSSGRLSGRHCLVNRTECRYNNNHYNRNYWTTYSRCAGSPGYRGYWSGQIVYAPYFKGALRETKRMGCERGSAAVTQFYEICRNYTQSVPATPSCPAGYGLSGAQCVKNAVSWKTDCTLLPECQPVSEHCVEGPATRTINGVPVTLPCWKYKVLHECDLPDTCALLSDCTENGRECSQRQNGVCIEEKISKTCVIKTCREVSLECGEQSFCLDGECYIPTPETSDDFDQAAASLAGVSEAAEGIGDPPRIFTDTPMKCSKKALGIADCCKDGGWGTDIGLAQCSEEEKALGLAKEKGLTIYIGQYCAEKILGKCIRKKRAYCRYDSLLGKIIQQQGALAQLGKTLGSPEHPTCEPITPEELASINFEHIDFAEFYPEMHSNIPDPNQMQQRLQSAIQQRLQSAMQP
ncbi:type-F conjugative transfer system mating-pair stabilization protein TraN [Vibrio pectenicida]|uniref:type-F conjugative transfer system mating-pair stabilization protein TraN n=1 Tax=Vibrio pectenicida TaxID=62763 RepID=UPI003B9A2332